MKIILVALDPETHSADIELLPGEEVQALAISGDNDSEARLLVQAIIDGEEFCPLSEAGLKSSMLFNSKLRGEGVIAAVPDHLRGLPLRVRVMNAPEAKLWAVIRECSPSPDAVQEIGACG